MITQYEDLDKLEEDIRRLKNRYDQFFNGIVKAPPTFERGQVESIIHELSREKTRDKARRFRFSTILSRFNQYRELWARRMREREEGPLDFRRRQAMMAADPEPALPPANPRVTFQAPDAYVKMTPDDEGEPIRRLYEDIQRAHVAMGTASNVTLDQLTRMVQQQSAMVRAKYNVKTVAFRVDTVDGKVKLKAKPLQDKE